MGRAATTGWHAQAAAAEAEIAPLRWRREVDASRRRDRLQQAHLVVSLAPRVDEALPLLEAICAGTPVLAADTPSHRALLPGLPRALLPAHEPRAWIDAITALRHEPSVHASLAAACRAEAARFAPAVEREALRAVVADALAGAARGHEPALF